MATHNEIVEVESNVVKITTGGVEKEYNKTDLKCSATDIMVFLYYYTDSKNQIVASWNEYQAEQYGYTLDDLKTYIDTLLDLNSPNLSNLNLGSIGQYDNQTDAIGNGLKNGDVYCIPKSSDIVLLAIVRALISAYTAGVSNVGFVTDSNDGWDVALLAAPTASQKPSGVTLVDCEYKIDFWNNLVKTAVDSGTITTNQTPNTGARGEGVYEVVCKYTFSDGSHFRVRGLYRVDATDTIIASILMGGISVNSVSGLNMNVTANITQVGCSYIPYWGAFDASDNGTQVGSGTTAVDIALPITTTKIGCLIDLDSIFSDDYDGDNAINATVSIS